MFHIFSMISSSRWRFPQSSFLSCPPPLDLPPPVFFPPLLLSFPLPQIFSILIFFPTSFTIFSLFSIPHLSPSFILSLVPPHPMPLLPPPLPPSPPQLLTSLLLLLSKKYPAHTLLYLHISVLKPVLPQFEARHVSRWMGGIKAAVGGGGVGGRAGVWRAALGVAAS